MDSFRLTYISFKSTLTNFKIRLKNLTVTLHPTPNSLCCSIDKNIFHVS